MSNEKTNTKVRLKNNKRKQLGREVGIPVRRLDQDYEIDMPFLWIRDNEFVSCYFTALSATLPAGEDQFLYSVRLFLDKITEPTLKKQVRAFIGQEAHHSREHESINNAMKEMGFELEKIEAWMDNYNQWVRKTFSPEAQLAITVCGEHLTALMADWALVARKDSLDKMDGQVKNIWAWHSIEELEHKGVAFDVYDQFVGDRELLHRTMLIMTIFFIPISFTFATRQLKVTGGWSKPRMWKGTLSTLYSLYKHSKMDYMDFYKPDYHPWQHDCLETLKKARAEFLGEADSASNVA